MTDTKEIINCPACNCKMTKIVVPNTNVSIDICTDGCGGIFFDNRELDKFDDEHENADEIFKNLKGKTFKSVDTEQTRICPACSTPMVKMGAGKGNVEIDVCNVCGGKFLDNGELQKIREGKVTDTDGVDEIFNQLYAENLQEVLGNNAHKQMKSSLRRQSVENLVFKYLNNY